MFCDGTVENFCTNNKYIQNSSQTVSWCSVFTHILLEERCVYIAYVGVQNFVNIVILVQISDSNLSIELTYGTIFKMNVRESDIHFY